MADLAGVGTTPDLTVRVGADVVADSHDDVDPHVARAQPSVTHTGGMGEKQTGNRRRSELTDFLRTRRARLRPQELGLVTGNRRRVPGLRREETASLAGVSTDYYVRLEQGRAGRPSEEVLGAVAAALQLTTDEREHLARLTRPKPPARPQHTALRQEVRALLATFTDIPAFVINERMDVLAANPLATALILDCATTPASRVNAARMIFLDPVAERYYPHWDDVAREAVAHLRLALAADPHDKFEDLLVELSGSVRFRELWARHDVGRKSHGIKHLCHPTIGEVQVRYETLTLPADPDQTLVIYLVEPGSNSERALEMLGTTTRS